MKLSNLFKKQTNYPTQQIPPKALSLLEELDEHLITNRMSSPMFFTISHLELSITDQFKPVSSLLNYSVNNIKPHYYYIPRSIAFTISPDGTYNYYIGLYYPDQTTCHEITISMYNDLLIRTNNARNNNENPI
jgi:hypothetical protein